MIAGIETALIGMREGGYRKVRISPHLAYRGTGVSGKIPKNAVLIYELWLNAIEERRP
jgi:FKBP-type peptidyl-prolyl cis-trans isomerase